MLLLGVVFFILFMYVISLFFVDFCFFSAADDRPKHWHIIFSLLILITSIRSKVRISHTVMVVQTRELGSGKKGRKEKLVVVIDQTGK